MRAYAAAELVALLTEAGLAVDSSWGSWEGIALGGGLPHAATRRQVLLVSAQGAFANTGAASVAAPRVWIVRSLGDSVEAESAADGGGAVRHVELLVDVVEVLSDGAKREPKSDRDLFV